MIHKILRYGLVLIASLGVAACSDFLEENGYSNFTEKQFYENEQQVVLATNGVYEVLRSVVDAHQFVGMVGTDEARMWAGAVAHRPIDAWTFDTNTQLLGTMYSALFTGINRANAVMEGVARSPLGERTKRIYTAEMRFLRAFYYYWLVRLYGAVPLKTVSSYSYETAFAGKASVAEIYEAIVADLEAASAVEGAQNGVWTVAPLLPKTRTTGNVGRATYGAAKAYLAAVHLSMTGYPLYRNTTEDWRKIIDLCQEVIDLADEGIYELLPSYADVFTMENSKESIFEMQAGSTAGTGCSVKTHMGVIGIFPVVYHQNDPSLHWPDTRVGRGNIRPCWKFYNTYFPTGDRRRSFSCSDYVIRGVDAAGNWTNTMANIVRVEKESIGSALTNLGIAKYRFPETWNVAKFQDTDNPHNWVFMRYAEVLLTMAEAQYHVNGYSACVKYLQPLSERAGVGVWDGTGDFDERMLAERGWELCFEGKRWFDLQRFDKLYEYVSGRDQGQNVPYGNFLQTAITPTQRHYPIPQSEVDANPYL